ncbi:MAG: sugar ABC transporter permease [Planctomycetota bacterium]
MIATTSATPDGEAPRGSLRPYRLWTPYLFVAPGFAVLAVFVLAAMAQVIGYSFTDYNAFNAGRWVGLENYQRLMADDRFWFCLGNSFLYLLVTPVLMVLSLWAAMLVHAGLRFAWGLRMWLFFPVITPTIVAAIAWRVLLNEDSGLLNTMLGWVGVGAVNWLSERPFTLMSAMLVTMWKGFGYFMMVFLAGLVAIPRELEEAATVDGAGRVGRFVHVTLPGLRPVLVLVALISSVSALKVFDELYVTIQGAPISHQTAVPLIFNTAFDRGDFGLACAQGVVLFLVVLVFSMVQLRLGGDR